MDELAVPLGPRADLRGLTWLWEPFENEDPPFEPQEVNPYRAMSLVAAGCDRVLDGLFHDIYALSHEPAGDVEYAHVLSRLPRSFRFSYDVHFAKQFLRATAVVAHRLATGWEVPGSLAEELALDLILDDAEEAADEFGVLSPGQSWRIDVQAALCEDFDFMDLYDGGPFQPPVAQWFAPYRP